MKKKSKKMSAAQAQKIADSMRKYWRKRKRAEKKAA